MIIDTSAIMAIVKREAGWRALLHALATDTAKISAGTLTELMIVTENGISREARNEASALLSAVTTEVVPVQEEDAVLAADAYARFGKGNHPARLNFGDCFAYALAKRTSEPLLCVGNDFARTDILLVAPEAS